MPVQPHGLDDLQALVHQCRTVDGDFFAHLPVWVLQRVPACVTWAAAAPGSCRRTARRSRSGSGGVISPRSRQPMRHWKMAECSESTGMISAPTARRLRHDQLAGADQRLLVGEADALALPDGRRAWAAGPPCPPPPSRRCPPAGAPPRPAGPPGRSRTRSPLASVVDGILALTPPPPWP